MEIPEKNGTAARNRSRIVKKSLMKEPSELEKYLRKQSAEGNKQGKGRFTLAKNKALAKLSNYQLPFEGAWAVKLVQSGVLNPKVRSLHFAATKEETKFWTTGNQDWTLDQIETALGDPEYSKDPALFQFITALRVVGLGKKRPFLVEQVGCREQIVWDGQELTRETTSKLTRHFAVTICNRALNDRSDTVRGSSYAARNAAVSKNLYQFCHTCPKPLKLDGARIDGLELSPKHGWGQSSQLLALGFQDGDLPPLPIPERTSQQKVVSRTQIHSALSSVTSKHRKAARGQESAGLAFLLSAHLTSTGSGWTYGEGQSTIYWVSDGVIVQSEPIDIPQSLCSVGCFASVQGLKTDLTGFNLIETKELRTRRQEVPVLLQRGIAEIQSLDFTQLAKEAPKGHLLPGVAMGFVGGLGSLIMPLKGLAVLALGAAHFLGSAASVGNSGSEQSQRLSLALEKLLADIANLASPSVEPKR